MNASNYTRLEQVALLLANARIKNRFTLPFGHSWWYDPHHYHDGWVNSNEFCNQFVGGHHGDRRKRELQAGGIAIQEMTPGEYWEKYKDIRYKNTDSHFYRIKYKYVARQIIQNIEAKRLIKRK